MNESAPPLPSAVVNPNHPCGPTATVSLHAVPREPGFLEPELVREIDADGSVLRTWPVPIDQIPVAVSGDAVLLGRQASSHWIQVGPGGELSTAPAGASPPTPFVCPNDVAGVRSAYLRCVRVDDLTTGRSHLLAFEGPCT